MTPGRTLTTLTAMLLLAAAPAGATDTAAAEAALQATLTRPGTLAGGAAVIIVGVLSLLYVSRRRVYIGYWVAGWGCLAWAMFMAGPSFVPSRVSGLLFGLSQFATFCSALFFVVAADSYAAAPRIRRQHGLMVLPIATWFVLAPLALGPASVAAPGHLLTAIALVFAGGSHLSILRSARLLGAGVIGVTLIVTAAVHLALAASGTTRPGHLPPEAFLAQLALYLVTALGMQLMTFEDMTLELRRANARLESAQAELRQLVVTDALTGCRNRRFFDEIISHELSSHRRYGTPLSVLFVDIDHFKSINDTLGHAAGDRALRDVAQFLMRNTRDADYVFRWGGDEFLLLLSCREDEAVRRGQWLQAEFGRSPAAAALPPSVRLSFGCAEVSPLADTAFDALKLADERMYENKRARVPPEGEPLPVSFQ